jgi:hypothetical protein
MNKSFLIFLVAFLVWPIDLAKAAHCALDDMQSCHSCPEVAKAIDLHNPDGGEYYKGAFWNGLYAAYRFDCLDIGRQLLDHKANPNLGGTSGSFLVTLVQAWPHDKLSINEKWVDLVKHYPIDPGWKNPWADEGAAEIVAKGEVPVAYRALWDKITSK